MRLNMPAPHRDRDLVAQGYAYVARTGIFRVAEVDGRLAALACAIVRGDQWFLSGFWVDPALRLQGIGGPLLREVWDEGLRAGARVCSVWSSPDHAAMASYMKLGMLPGMQLFAFAGTPRLGAGTAVPARDEPLTPERVAGLDRDVVGVRRDEDHAYWLGRNGARGVVVRIGGQDVGYHYTHDGTIGPVAWSRDDVAEVVLSEALRAAGGEGREVLLTVPGTNHAAIRVALAAGLRLIRSTHYLWTAPVGRMERYLPSGPLLF